jgi:hypothetical protein
MKPGRELDALISKTIMNPNETTSILHLPWYSTNVSDAWLIVEHFSQLGWEVEITSDSQMKPEVEYSVVFSPRHTGTGGSAAVVFSDNVPHAICLAALKATSTSIV